MLIALLTWGSYLTFLSFSFFIIKTDYIKIVSTANAYVKTKTKIGEIFSIVLDTYLSTVIIFIDINRNKIEVQQSRYMKERKKKNNKV